MIVARSGKWEQIEILLIAGANPEDRDNFGRSALHYAARCGKAKAAACLLAYGADHKNTDIVGRSPLSLDFIDMVTLHSIRQQYRRFRKKDLIKRNNQSSSDKVERWGEELDQKGILKIPGFVSFNLLTELRREFEDFISRLEQEVSNNKGQYSNYDEEEHYWQDDHAYISNNAFKSAPQLAKLCSHRNLLELASTYYGEAAYIARGTTMRYLSSDRTRNDMFRWHHDLVDKRFKIMILLTDLTEDDQCMSYVIGSHKILHPLNMFYSNAADLKYCRKHMGEVKVVSATGNAGDIFVFDSNGIHRGNRRANANIRDVYFVEYDPSNCNIWGGDIPEGLQGTDTFNGINGFEKMVAVKKRWEIPFNREYPTWIEDLAHIDRWL